MKELKNFFEAKSIAIIGASHSQGKIGYSVLENFVKNNFNGKIFPINPNTEEILGLRCYKSVLEVKEKIDLAIIVVPAEFVVKVLEECVKKKVFHAIVISAGFSEIGDKKQTQKLENFLKKHKNFRIIGPNCLGILDTITRIDSLFLPINRLQRPASGSISFVSQSGALGSAVIDWAAMKGYGLNRFVSYGNAMDVDESDLLEFLADDKETKVIVLYIEGVQNGKKFFFALQKASSKKPVIVIKGGTSSEGSKAVASHTGALAGNAKVFEAVIKQANAIQAKTMQEVFDFARVFALEPKMLGKKIQIITNGGGYGVLATDSVIENELELARMDNNRKKLIAKHCPSYAVIENPIDLIGDANAERYKVALEQALLDRNVNAIICILLFQVPTLEEEIIKIVREINAKKTKPLLFVSVGGNYTEKMISRLKGQNINVFDSPTAAAEALKKLFEHCKKAER